MELQILEYNRNSLEHNINLLEHIKDLEYNKDLLMIIKTHSDGFLASTLSLTIMSSCIAAKINKSNFKNNAENVTQTDFLTIHY